MMDAENIMSVAALLFYGQTECCPLLFFKVVCQKLLLGFPDLQSMLYGRNIAPTVPNIFYAYKQCVSHVVSFHH